MKIIKREDRLRPLLVTPPKGGEGDCTDETMAGMCDINRIIQRYGGNLAELAAWRGSMRFGDQPPDNLEDALEMLKNAKDICAKVGADDIVQALEKLTNPAEPAPAEPAPAEPASAESVPAEPVDNKETV